ncbi:peptidoglycan-binding domain-containing protein [Kitasatospora cinereorecta]|uniref:Peptidoglycan-binding protein n=1 Tax=Kitasatospora cinereorecta TaxID=285560 RepID=A0ABW0V686_9ACTN
MPRERTDQEAFSLVRPYVADVVVYDGTLADPEPAADGERQAIFPPLPPAGGNDIGLYTFETFEAVPAPSTAGTDRPTGQARRAADRRRILLTSGLGLAGCLMAVVAPLAVVSRENRLSAALTEVLEVPPEPGLPDSSALPALRTPTPARTMVPSGRPSSGRAATGAPSESPARTAAAAGGDSAQSAPLPPTGEPGTAGPVAQSPTPQPTDSGSAPARALKQGDSGPEVRSLQEQLTRAGCGKGRWTPTGTFDDTTLRMLRQFQGTSPDLRSEAQAGEYGPKTRARLEKRAARTC